MLDKYLIIDIVIGLHADSWQYIDNIPTNIYEKYNSS